MGGLFGGSDNSAAKAAEKAAKDAAKREAERQANIKKAIGNIDKVFSEQGTLSGYAKGDLLPASTYGYGAYYNPAGQLYDWQRPTYDLSNFSSLKDGSLGAGGSGPTGPDLAAFNQWAGLPANYQIWSPTQGGTAPAWYSYENAPTGEYDAFGTPLTSGGTWSLDPYSYIKAQLGEMSKAGKLYGGTPQYGNGFNDNFYNAKAQSYLDYYQPQLQEQYGKAKDQLTYGLANAGLLRSSAANKENADLFKQNQYQEIGLQQQAQSEATKLRQQVAGEKSALISQALASADPDLASNQAAAAAKNLHAADNDYDPLSEVFKNAIVGGGNYYQGYQQGNMASKYPIPSVYGAGSGRVY